MIDRKLYRKALRESNKDYKEVLFLERGDTPFPNPKEYWTYYDGQELYSYEENFNWAVNLLGYQSIADWLSSRPKGSRKALDIMAPPGSFIRDLAEKDILDIGYCMTAIDARFTREIEIDDDLNLYVQGGNVGASKYWKFNDLDLITFRPFGGIKNNLGSLYIILKSLYKSYKSLTKNNGLLLFEYIKLGEEFSPVLLNLLEVISRDLPENTLIINKENLSFAVMKTYDSPDYISLKFDQDITGFEQDLLKICSSRKIVNRVLNLLKAQLLLKNSES